MKLPMSYSHNDLTNNNNNTNTGGTPFYLQSLATRGERHNHKSLYQPYYADPTPLPRAAHLVVFKISSGSTQNDLIWSDPKNPAARFNDRNSKSSKFSGHLLREWRHPPNQFTLTAVQPISCLGVYLDRCWLSYLFHPNLRLHHLTWTKRHRVVQSLT